MKLDKNKFTLKEINENMYNILYDNNTLKFMGPKILIPVGLENEYGKYLIKLELEKENLEHIYLKKIILHLEKIMKEKLEIKDENNEIFKSILQIRKNNNEFLECRIKNIKNNMVTTIEYEDKDNNYLKTIYDLPKQSYVKIQFEINGLWDYRDNTDKNKIEKNKVGLIVYASKIIVLK
jgi:hypothetical protein